MTTTTEYYQVEESTNGGPYWADRDYRLTLDEAKLRIRRQRNKEEKRARKTVDGQVIWQYRIVKVTETREVVTESEG